MARQTRPSTPVKPAPAPVQSAKTTRAAVAASGAAFDWDRFGATAPAPIVVQYARAATAPVDREASTPQFIKDRVRDGYAKFAANGSKPVSQLQIVPTVDAAETFLKLGKLYATFAGMTMRGKVLTDSEISANVQNGNLPSNFKAGVPVVSYTVKDKETRRKA